MCQRHLLLRNCLGFFSDDLRIMKGFIFCQLILIIVDHPSNILHTSYIWFQQTDIFIWLYRNQSLVMSHVIYWWWLVLSLVNCDWPRHHHYWWRGVTHRDQDLCSVKCHSRSSNPLPSNRNRTELRKWVNSFDTLHRLLSGCLLYSWFNYFHTSNLWERQICVFMI